VCVSEVSVRLLRVLRRVFVCCVSGVSQVCSRELGYLRGCVAEHRSPGVSLLVLLMCC
jgi:hypothetical protein